MTNELITLRDWCKMMSIGMTTAYKLMKAGQLNAVKIGKLTMITREETQRFISNLPAAEFRA
jgi:excisionase family DNA binding protein